MAYRLEILHKAVKEYHAVPRDERPTVKKAILALERTPRGPQVIKLEGSNYYRLRTGDWRVVFAISDAKHLVTVIAVERRTSTTY